jgi:CYTH domain-containing protein
MALEIEKKFLIKQIPQDLEQFPHKEITQWYFSDPSTGKSIRVRKIGSEYIVTRKKWHGVVRNETETKINKEEFDEMWMNVENRFLKKTRYYIPYEWKTIELDVYKNLHWFVTAEVEFSTKREAKQFVAPQWFDEDLSMMREATNAYIANYWLSEELIAMIQE